MGRFECGRMTCRPQATHDSCRDRLGLGLGKLNEDPVCLLRFYVRGGRHVGGTRGHDLLVMISGFID